MSSSARIFLLLLLLGAGCGKPSPATSWPSSTTDPAVIEARKLLTEAGFEFGKGFPKLTLIYNTLESHKKIASVAQETWRTALGIDIQLRNVDWAVLMSARDQGDFDILRSGYSGEYSDPYSLLSLFTSDGGFNTGGWRSEEFDRLIAASNLERDPAKRYEVLGRAESLLVKEAPLLPIYFYLARNMVKPFIKGVHPNGRDLHPLKYVSMEGPGAPDKNPLIYNGGEEPQFLDPARSHDMQGLVVLMNLFDGLVSYDPKDAHPIPAAAESWEVSPDEKTYTFHIRKAHWSNGDPVTAHDFVYSWRRVVNPETTSKYSDRMFDIEGAREALASGDPSKLAVRAVDDRTFEVKLGHRTPHFLQLVCLNIFFPVHRATVEKHKDKWTDPGNIVSNGAYVLTERRFKERKTLEANPKYWDAANVRLKKAVILSVPDSDVAFRMYEQSEIHWLYTIPTTYSEEIAKRSDTFANLANRTYFYIFNTNHKPLNDVRVRRALSMCIDRKKIVDHVLRGGELPATTLTPPLYPGYEVK